MNTILLVAGHPEPGHSIANKKILELISREMTQVKIHDLRSLYPTDEFDVQEEQKKLIEADLIIVQAPFIWYGLPSHVKKWFEKVFSYGFAFGPGGEALKGKKLLLSITLGGSEEAYSIHGQHGNPVESFLLPVQMLARYVQMEYLEPIYSYEMGTELDSRQYTLQQKAGQHIRRIHHTVTRVQRTLLASGEWS